MTAMARLLDQYNTTIAPALATRFGVKNKMAIPRLEKVVINMGVGRATQDKAVLEAAVDGLARISGQKPVVTKAKVSVAGFRLREGNEIGCKVTLRGRRMYEFLDRLISIALPGSATSAASTPTASTGTATSRSAWPSRSSSPRSTPTACITPRGWTSRSSPRRPAMTRPASCSAPSACPSASPSSRVKHRIVGRKRPESAPDGNHVTVSPTCRPRPR
jgi:hypothetical protein